MNTTVESIPPRILILDDEANILNALKRLFRQEDFQLTTTVDPEEALQEISTGNYAVVVSDERMPAMNGTDFLEHARERSPDTIRILLTGYADINAAMKAINLGAVYRFLIKPWHDDELRLSLRQAVDQYMLVKENQRLQALTDRQNEELKDLNQNLKKRVMDRTWEILRLSQQLEGSFRGSIRMMGRISEMHSPVMEDHARRVASLSKELASRLGVEGEELEQIELAATVHDIGKLGLCTSVLKKPQGELKPMEKAAMLQHPLLGESLIQMVPNMDGAAVIIRHLHERYDGAGFPDQLSGSDIPLGSRIIAVVNRFDEAMNMRTDFQHASPEQALGFVRRYTPHELDPMIVSVLTDYLDVGEPEVRERILEAEVSV